MFAIRSAFPDCLLGLHSDQDHRRVRQSQEREGMQVWSIFQFPIWTIIRNLPTSKYRGRPYSMAGITSEFSIRRLPFVVLDFNRYTPKGVVDLVGNNLSHQCLSWKKTFFGW